MRQKSAPTGAKPSCDDLDRALAMLMACTRTTRRPVGLMELAKSIDLAVLCLGDVATVADRIGLSPKMLQQFLSVRRLTPEVQDLFAARTLDSVDASSQLALLSADDQKEAGKALSAREIDTADLRALVALRRDGDTDPIMKILEKVKVSKTTKEFVVEFVNRDRLSPEALRRLLAPRFPDSGIIRIDVQGALARLVLNREGKQALASVAKQLRVPRARVVPTMLCD